MQHSDTQVAAWAASNDRMWQDTGTVDFWRTWHRPWDQMVQQATDLLAEAAGITAGDRVLDLGSGHGEPALTFAQRVGPTGHVTATDVSPAMLALASDNLAAAPSANVALAVADAEHLPFASGVFDRVTSRFGLMYVPNPVRACAEAHRVLRPGGTVAFAVWGPGHRVPWYAGAMRVFMQYLLLPPLDPDAPGPFRFGAPGSLTTVLNSAAFSNVREDTHEITLTWPGDVRSFVAFLEAMHCGLIAQIPDRHHQRVHEQLHAACTFAADSDVVRLHATIVVASARKP